MVTYLYGYICDEINDVSIKTFRHKITKENYDEWESHWISTAIEIRDRYENDGLPETAKYVQEIIDDNQKWINRTKH